MVKQRQKNCCATSEPIVVDMANSAILKSTHEGYIDLPNLPTTPCKAHLIPRLAKHFLISVATLCDAGCNKLFTPTHCNNHHHESLLLQAPRDPTITLWKCQLHHNNQQGGTKGVTKAHHKHICNNAYQIKSNKDLMYFLHTACFSPPVSTSIKAVKKQANYNVARHYTRKYKKIPPPFYLLVQDYGKKYQQATTIFLEPTPDLTPTPTPSSNYQQTPEPTLFPTPNPTTANSKPTEPTPDPTPKRAPAPKPMLALIPVQLPNQHQLLLKSNYQTNTSSKIHPTPKPISAPTPKQTPALTEI